MTASKHFDRIRMADRQLPQAARESVLDVLESGSVAAGERVRAFESAVASFCDATSAVGTASGPTALHAALVAVGVEAGDRVLVPALGSTATASAVSSVGATPVVADVDPETYTLDPDAAERAVSDHDGAVDALVVTHRYGLPADMDALRALADDNDAALVEQVGGALGASYRGDPVGALGDVGCLSFSPTQPLTTGRGGMVLTDSEALAARAREFVATARTGTQRDGPPGGQFRMDEIAAALGLQQLDRLPALVRARRNNATRLRRQLADTDLATPFEPGYAGHTYAQFVVRCRRRDALQEHLDEFGIGSWVPDPAPLDDQAPVATTAAEGVLSLPVHPGLSQREIDTVGEAVTYFDSFV